MNKLKGDQNESSDYIMFFDGGSNPNPGKCAGAFVIYDPKGNKIAEGGKFIEYGTNNIGEYNGLLLGLKFCVENGWKRVKIYGDSKLVVSQVSGVWKIKLDHLRQLRNEIWKEIEKMEFVGIEFVFRDSNQIADQLSDETLELGKNWYRIY
jgi:ribonuclease HI